MEAEQDVLDRDFWDASIDAETSLATVAPDVDNSASAPATSSSPFAYRMRTASPSVIRHTSSGIPFEILNVKLRVITPPRPLPLESFDGDDHARVLRARAGEDLVVKATEILVKYGLGPPRITITSRLSRDDPFDRFPTLLIVGTWDAHSSPQLWEQVVVEIKEFLANKDDLNDKLAIEMIDEKLTRRKYVSLVHNNNEIVEILHQQWPEIRSRVYGMLQWYEPFRDRVALVALFRLGFDADAEKNPLTVYISVTYDSPEILWPPYLKNVQDYLDQTGLGLVAHLEHNMIGSSAFQLVNLWTKLDYPALGFYESKCGINSKEPYKNLVNLGDDIGPTRYIDDIRYVPQRTSIPGGGTLGC